MSRAKIKRRKWRTACELPEEQAKIVVDMAIETFGTKVRARFNQKTGLWKVQVQFPSLGPDRSFKEWAEERLKRKEK